MPGFPVLLAQPVPGGLPYDEEGQLPVLPGLLRRPHRGVRRQYELRQHYLAQGHHRLGLDRVGRVDRRQLPGGVRPPMQGISSTSYIPSLISPDGKSFGFFLQVRRRNCAGQFSVSCHNKGVAYEFENCDALMQQQQEMANGGGSGSDGERGFVRGKGTAQPLQQGNNLMSESMFSRRGGEPFNGGYNGGGQADLRRPSMQLRRIRKRKKKVMFRQ